MKPLLLAVLSFCAVRASADDFRDLAVDAGAAARESAERARGTGMRCAGVNARVMDGSQCCPGLNPEPAGHEFFACRAPVGDPTNRRCSFDGEAEDHRFGCCPGLESARYSHDGYVCLTPGAPLPPSFQPTTAPDPGCGYTTPAVGGRGSLTACEEDAVAAYADREGWNTGPNEAYYDVLRVRTEDLGSGRLRVHVTASRVWDGDGPDDGPEFTGSIDMIEGTDGICRVAR